MTKPRRAADREDAEARATEFLAQLQLNLDRVDAGVVSWDRFHARQLTIWAAIAAAGREVEERVLVALQAERAALR